MAPKLTPAPALDMLIAREQSKVPKPCSSSLQMAAMSGGGTGGAQTMERPHCMPNSPRVGSQCTSGLQIDSSDGPELHSCEFEGWDEQLWVNAGRLSQCASSSQK